MQHNNLFRYSFLIIYIPLFVKTFAVVMLNQFILWFKVQFDSMIQFSVRCIPLSYDDASGSEITPCNKNDKPLVVYRFLGNAMTSIITLHT